MSDKEDHDESSRTTLDLGRRDLLRLSTAGALLAASTGGCSKRQTPSTPAVSTNLVRVASVPTAVEGNLLPTLITAFEKEAPYKVELASHDDVYGLARAGHADLVVSHYGHKHAEAFVMGGLGEWPRTLFSNHIDGVRYLTEVLWNAAGRPDRAGWLLDEGRRKDDAIRYASGKGAYSFWGLTPFVRLRRESPLRLEPLVLGDPLLQRMLVSIVVKPHAGPAVNVTGAHALQDFLLSPATQARIREVRYPGAEGVQWVPGGRHNRTGILPMG